MTSFRISTHLVLFATCGLFLACGCGDSTPDSSTTGGGDTAAGPDEDAGSHTDRDDVGSRADRDGGTTGGSDTSTRRGSGEPYEGPPFVDEDPTVEQPDDNPAFDDHPQLKKIEIPEGFQIRMYAEVPGARSLEWAGDDTLFVGSRGEGKVRAVRDTDGDRVGDEVLTIASGMNRPNGVAFKDGDLYVAEVSKVWRFPDILENLQNPSKTLVNDSFPDDRHHGWKYIAFGPDGKLYVPVGAPCNICKKDYDTYSNIKRMDPDGSNLETYVKGVRNTVGFDWHPESGELWFTDNGRDLLGDNSPPDELNRVLEKGEHFGYPYCHGGFVQDPEFDSTSCDPFVPPTQKLGPHVAALGIEFYEGDMFPGTYEHVAFIAEHGSWDRSKKIGYRVTLVRLNEQYRATSYEVFAKGWLQGEDSWGRPVDVEVLPDGSMLVSDDAGGRIYRIVYTGG